MSTTSTKVLDLAMAELSKDEKAKKAEALAEAVEANKMAFMNEEFNAKKAVSSCKKALEALSKNPSATARQILDAKDNLALAVREHESISAIMAERF